MTIDFVESTAEVAGNGASPDLLIVDDVAARRAEVDALLRRLGPDVKVVLLANPLAGDSLFEVLRDARCDHLIGREQEVIDEDELTVTSIKLRRGDIFGLEKYLTWGVALREAAVASYDEKRAAIGAVTDFAREAGLKRQLIARIECVTDELLMNALYDAPAQRYGCRPIFQSKGRPGAGPVTAERALLSYGCDARSFAVGVRDSFGELEKSNIVDHLARARDEKGLPQLGEDGGGGGLGLYFILNSVTRFVANVEPGRATEVICLFDLRCSPRETPYGARSLSVFVRPAAPSATVD